MATRVGAVVVTFNRKDLLREALAALRAQTRPLDHILVIDNASTDGTPDLLRAEFPDVEVVRLDSNRGGAGGFHEGLRRAYQQGHDWVWAMDDDTIPRPDALAAMLAAHDRFPEGQRPVILSSQVVWTDGNPHPHNRPHSRRIDADYLMLAASLSTLAVRNASFVSMLVSRGAIAKHGLPYPDFFIWNDDVEYTARILRHDRGVYVPASVVCHKTRSITHALHNTAGPRFFYEVRNKIWMMKMPATWTRAERFDLLRILIGTTWRYLKHERFRPRALWAVAKGLFLGLFTSPRREPALPPG